MATADRIGQGRSRAFSSSQNVLLDRAVLGLPWEDELSHKGKEGIVWRGRGETGGRREGQGKSIPGGTAPAKAA